MDLDTPKIAFFDCSDAWIFRKKGGYPGGSRIFPNFPNFPPARGNFRKFREFSPLPDPGKRGVFPPQKGAKFGPIFGLFSPWRDPGRGPRILPPAGPSGPRPGSRWGAPGEGCSPARLAVQSGNLLVRGCGRLSAPSWATVGYKSRPEHGRNRYISRATPTTVMGVHRCAYEDAKGRYVGIADVDPHVSETTSRLDRLRRSALLRAQY